MNLFIPPSIARLLVSFAGGYLAVGVVFAVGFVTRGVQRLDPQARDGTWGFRLLLLPGATLLWPLLLARWRRGDRTPPEEHTAHRVAARRSAHCSAGAAHDCAGRTACHHHSDSP
jgi:hypothetical protein